MSGWYASRLVVPGIPPGRMMVCACAKSVIWSKVASVCMVMPCAPVTVFWFVIDTDITCSWALRRMSMVVIASISSNPSAMNMYCFMFFIVV